MPSAFLWFFQLFFFALLASSAGLVHHGQGTGLAQAPEACPLSSANSTAHLRGRNASGPQYCPEGGIKAARTPLQIFAAKTSFAEVGYTRKRSHGVTLLVRGLLYEQVVEGCILPNVWGQTAAVHHSLGLDGITEAKGYLTAFTTEKTATFRHSAAGQRQAAVVAKAEQGQGEGNEIESLQRRDASQGSVKCTTGTHDDGVATATDCTDDDLHEYIVNGSCSTVGRQTGASAVALGDESTSGQAPRLSESCYGNTPGAGVSSGSQGPPQGSVGPTEGPTGIGTRTCCSSQLSGGLECLPGTNTGATAETGRRSRTSFAGTGRWRTAMDGEFVHSLDYVAIESWSDGRRRSSGRTGRRGSGRGTGRSDGSQSGRPDSPGASTQETAHPAERVDAGTPSCCGTSQSKSGDGRSCCGQGKGQDTPPEAPAAAGTPRADQCVRRRRSDKAAPWQGLRLETSQWTPTLGLTHTVISESDCVHPGHAALLGMALQYEVSRGFEVQLISDPRTLEVDDAPVACSGVFLPPKAPSPDKGLCLRSGCICPSSLASRNASSRTPRLVRFADSQGHGDRITTKRPCPHLQVLRRLRRCQLPCGPSFQSLAPPCALPAPCVASERARRLSEHWDGCRIGFSRAQAIGPATCSPRHCDTDQSCEAGSADTPVRTGLNGTEAIYEASQGLASPAGEEAPRTAGIWTEPEIFHTQVPLSASTPTAWLNVACPLPLSHMETSVAEALKEGAYTFFDTMDHMRLRSIQPSWDFQQILQDAVRASNDGPITSVTVLRPQFEGLPSIQLILRAAHVTPGWAPVPVDLRQVGRGFCTYSVPLDASAYEAALRFVQVCPGPPRRFAPDVARGRLSLDSLSKTQGDPFAPGILHPTPALVTKVHVMRADSTSGTSTSGIASDTDNSTTARFGVVPHEEHHDELTVAFHTPGRPPWITCFARVCTQAHLVEAAANHFAGGTDALRWRLHFLPLQPHFAGVDLHCIILPAEGANACHEAILADFRGIFGPSPRALVAIPFDRQPPQVEQRILEKVRQFLIDSALVDPPQDFILSLASKGGILALAQPAIHAVQDTIEVASQFPGLRQTLMSAIALRGTSTSTTSTTTTTTPEVHDPASSAAGSGDAYPSHPVPRNPLVCRLGIPEFGAVTVEFLDNPDLGHIMAALWHAAARKGASLEGFLLSVNACQPEQRVAYRELLFTLVPAAAERGAWIWVDRRPIASLLFVVVPSSSSTEALPAADSRIKGWYLNGVRWEGFRFVPSGSLVVPGFTHEAPDIRPVGYFLDRLPGLAACMTPMPPPGGGQLEPLATTAADWQQHIVQRLTDMGHAQPSQQAIVVGEGFFTVVPVSGAGSLPFIAGWLHRWARNCPPNARIYQTNGVLNGRHVYILGSTDLDDQTEYLRLSTTNMMPVLFRVPHRAFPEELRRIAPIEDSGYRPVPGRPWFACFFPSADFSEHIDLPLEGPFPHNLTADRPSTPEPLAGDLTFEQARRWHRPMPTRHPRPPSARRDIVGRLDSACDVQEVSETASSSSAAPLTTVNRFAGRPRAARSVYYHEATAGPAQSSTTITTTNTFTLPGRPMLFLVSGNAVAGTQPEGMDASSLINAISSLMLEHAARGSAPPQGGFRLAQAQPGRTGPIAEILAVWYPLDLHLHVLVDRRPLGGGLQHVSVDSDHLPTDFLEEAEIAAGAQAYVNGVPANALAGTLQDGDYVLLTDSPQAVPALPRAALFRTWPHLDLFAVDFATADLFPLPTDVGLAFDQIHDGVARACEARFVLLGRAFAYSQPALVHSRVRGEIQLHINCRLPASAAQVEEALALLPEWQDARTVFDTGMMSGEAPIFLAQDIFESRENWHLIPVPYFLRLFLLWPVNEQVVQQAGTLPAPPHLQVNALQQHRHGTVHHFHPRDTDAHSLLQLTSLSRKGSNDPAEPPPEDAMPRPTYVGCKADHYHAVIRQPTSLRLVPDDFDEIVDRVFLNVALQMAPRAPAEVETRFTVFDPVFQTRVLTHQPGRRWEWTLLVVLRATARPIRAIQRLTEPIWGFPEPQFVVTFETAPPDHVAIPVDGRPLGHAICTVHLGPRATWAALGRVLQQTMPETRDCRGVGDRFLSVLQEGHLLLSDAARPLTDPLPDRLIHSQYLTPHVRPPTPPLPACPTGVNDSDTVPKDTPQQETPDAQPDTTTEPETRPGEPGLRNISVPTPQGRRNILAPDISAAAKTTAAPSTCLRLEHLLPPLAPGIAFGVLPEVCTHALQEHTWSCLTQELESLFEVLPVARAGWQALMPYHKELPLQACYFYTDGSYYADKQAGGWSVVVLGLQNGHVVKVGWVGGTVPHATSAYEGEVRAIVHAQALFLNQAAAFGVIASDCSAALDLVCSEMPASAQMTL